MIDIKYVILDGKHKNTCVVEAMQLSDYSWLLIDTYRDLKREYDVGEDWERISRYNIIGVFSQFSDAIMFLKIVCGNCGITWV